MNEVSAELRAEITNFLNRYFKGNIILTTQPLLKWNPPGVAGVYELLPLEKDQIQAFLHSRESALPDSAYKKGKDYKDACTAYLNKALTRPDTCFDIIETQNEVQVVLSNPMDLTIVSALIARGEEPNLFRLQDHQYRLMAKDFKQETGNREFPLVAFSEAVFDMRINDESEIPSDDFEDELKCLLEHKLVLHRQRQTKERNAKDIYTFRHDKIMDYFIVQTFLGKENERLLDYVDDPRFKGVYLLLALLMPEEEAQNLRERLIVYAADSGDHSVSDDFIKLFKGRESYKFG